MTEIRNYHARAPRFAVHTIDENVTRQGMAARLPGVDYLAAGDSYVTWGERIDGDPKHLVLAADTWEEARALAEILVRDYSLPVDITDGGDWAEDPDHPHPRCKGWAEWRRDNLGGDDASRWAHLIRVPAREEN